MRADGLDRLEGFALTGCSCLLKTSTGKVFGVTASFENDVEVTLYKHGGLLNFVARKFS